MPTELSQDHPPGAQLQLFLLKERKERRKATEEGLKKAGKESAARNPAAICQGGEKRVALGQWLRAGAGSGGAREPGRGPPGAGCAQPEAVETGRSRGRGGGRPAAAGPSTSTVPARARLPLPATATVLKRGSSGHAVPPPTPSGSRSPAFFAVSRDAPPQTRDPLGASSRPSAKSRRLYFSSSLFPS